MAKPKVRSSYVCGACGASTPQWAGQCPDCGEWNTLSEFAQAPQSPSKTGGRFAGYAGKSGRGVRKLGDVRTGNRPEPPRGWASWIARWAAVWLPVPWC